MNHKPRMISSSCARPVTRLTVRLLCPYPPEEVTDQRTPSFLLRRRCPILGAAGISAVNKNPNTFSEELRDFVRDEKWTYAKTMPQWPHEYIVRERVDEKVFEQLVRHIRENGCEGLFYKETFTFYEDEGMLYWTMGAPISETTIINRCKKENSYECRLRNGTLPE